VFYAAVVSDNGHAARWQSKPKLKPSPTSCNNSTINTERLETPSKSILCTIPLRPESFLNHLVRQVVKEVCHQKFAPKAKANELENFILSRLPQDRLSLKTSLYTHQGLVKTGTHYDKLQEACYVSCIGEEEGGARRQFLVASPVLVEVSINFAGPT
jgi:hypothetical protein